MVDDVVEGEDAPEFKDGPDLHSVVDHEVPEGVEDGDVEGQQLSGWGERYLAKLISPSKKVICTINYK